MPRGEGALNRAYEETLTRIKSQLSGFASLARKTLMWLVYAKRELSVEELRYALAIEENSSELDEENLEDADQIISVCKGLVKIDHETENVRLVHYTTQEYLKRVLPYWVPDAQEIITKDCLQYLSFRSIRSSLRGEYLKSPLSEQKEPDDYIETQYQDHILLRYVVGHCVSHAKSCWNKNVETLILGWLSDEHTVASYLEVFFARLIWTRRVRYSRTNNTALHMSAILDCEAVTAKLLSDSRVNVNAMNSEGETALHKAVQYKRESIAIQLLDREDIEIDVQDNGGATPLLLAARKGLEDVAIRLLRRDQVRVNLQDKEHRTALHSAAEQGLEVLVWKLLRREDVQINVQDYCGQTPLMCAVSEGHQAIVGLLLEKDEVKVNVETFIGTTALILCALFGHEAICKVLLERDDVQFNLPSKHWGTALSLAASKGNDVIVRLLLQRDDVDVNNKCNSGYTALMRAAESGHRNVVRSLLEKDDIELDCREEEGQTALMLAYRSGHKDIVNILQEAGAPGEIPCT